MDRPTNRPTNQWTDERMTFSVATKKKFVLFHTKKFGFLPIWTCFRPHFTIKWVKFFCAQYDYLWSTLINLYKLNKIAMQWLYALKCCFWQFLLDFDLFLGISGPILCKNAQDILLFKLLVGIKQLVQKNATNHWFTAENNIFCRFWIF